MKNENFYHTFLKRGYNKEVSFFDERIAEVKFVMIPIIVGYIIFRLYEHEIKITKIQLTDVVKHVDTTHAEAPVFLRSFMMWKNTLII